MCVCIASCITPLHTLDRLGNAVQLLTRTQSPPGGEWPGVYGKCAGESSAQFDKLDERHSQSRAIETQWESDISPSEVQIYIHSSNKIVIQPTSGT